jgi:type VI secretion system secreted protein VgrG
VSLRTVELRAEAAPGPLLFHRLVGREELGRPFRYELEALSERNDLPIVDMLGTGVTVTLGRSDGSTRHLHGLVARAEYRGGDGDHGRYGLVLVPWLWFLGRRRDCRIFQEQDTPAILRAVLETWPVADFELALEGSYRPREYCVQYRESDLDFVSRLAEDEGITFFFRHREGGHTLVLVDGPGPCAAVPGYERIPYFPPRERARRERDHVDDWQAAAEVRSGKAALEDFDFEKPRTDLLASDADPRPHALAEAEIYDYPGGYRELSAGDAIVRLRLEEELAGHARAFGTGNASGLACGARFTLEGYPRASENRAWLVVATEIELASERYRSATDAPEAEPFRCRFEVQDLEVPYRPPRRTARPFVHGPQTAIVTGPSGEEIHCDKYGRVKVRFHWDRSGRRDATSSCWLRVSQAWAGAGWGAMHVPRIGQEVIVDFLEGNPDAPLVTGRVYNALAMPPWGLPGNATQSGIKSDSSKGGGGSNELRFEDKKGAEQVWLHAQKDEDIVVENDKTELVKHDETIEIGHDRKEKVGHDESLEVGNDRSRKVGGNETVSVDGNQAVTIGIDQTIDVLANQTITVGGDQAETVQGSRTDTVQGSEQRTVLRGRTETIIVKHSRDVTGPQTLSVSGGQTETIQVRRSTTVSGPDQLEVSGARTVEIGGVLDTTVKGAEQRKIAGGRTSSISKDDTLTVENNLSITAGDSIEIKTGKAMIIMKKDGSITIKGKDILIEGSGKIDIKADKNITMKGQKILQN